MEFGIFIEELRRGSTQPEWFEETYALVDAAEAWGLDGVWLGEIHFNPARSVLSSPTAVLGALAARTRRVRLGTAITVLPLGNPLRIAEDAATIDQLSHGRLDFGIGRSGSPRAYDALGIPYGESQARFVEALEVIRQAWTGERVSFHGKFFHFDNVAVGPRPVQEPHPPLRMAANSPETFEFVGRAGLPLFVGLRDHGIPELRTHLVTYRKAWREAGHPGDGDVCLRLPVYAAPTEKAAREEPYENMTYFFRRHAELTRSGLGRGDTGPADRRSAKVQQLEELTYDDILATRAAFGTAPALVDRLGELRDDLGLTGVVAELNPGGLLPVAPMERTLRILTHEVMPAFR
jgi:alkanesulfonate monooxygenase SsuD/methylene tetrahydromethanopterin reductase-like flavin-dependent oxidoreductase (luciferase family)